MDIETALSQRREHTNTSFLLLLLLLISIFFRSNIESRARRMFLSFLWFNSHYRVETVFYLSCCLPCLSICLYLSHSLRSMFFVLLLVTALREEVLDLL